MGERFCYTCKRCQHKYSASIGSGFAYPQVYRAKLAEIDAGDYGPDWQELYRKTPYAAINADYIIYLCKECGTWEVSTDITLYAPNDPESIPQKQYGIKTVAEWGHVPYVTGWDLKNDYHIVKRYYRHCRRCGKRMHKALANEAIELQCPKCGSKNQANEFWTWD